MALYNVYRPTTFDEVVGQDHVVITLQNEARRQTVSNTYLFSGPRGTGKTTVARIFAQAINCTNENKPCGICDVCKEFLNKDTLDLIEIDAASNTGVEMVREVITSNVQFLPNTSKYKIYIIDEAHMLSKSAFNALLKTLEEPPEYAVFILVTTEKWKLPDTILSRSQQHSFKRIHYKKIASRLNYIAEQENIDIRDTAIGLIAQMTEGCMRDAISLMDQMSSYGGEISADLVRDVLGLGDEFRIFNLIHHIADGDLGACINDIYETTQQGIDLKRFIGQVIENLHLVLRNNLGARMVMTDSTYDHVESTRISNIKIAKIIQALAQGLQDMGRVSFDQNVLINTQLAMVLSPDREEVQKKEPTYVPQSNEAVRALLDLGGKIVFEEDF